MTRVGLIVGLLAGVTVALLSTPSHAQLLEPLENTVEFEGFLSDTGVATWQWSAQRALVDTERFQIQTLVSVSENALDAQSNHGQLRFNVGLSPGAKWVTGLNLYAEQDLLSVDAQTGFMFDFDGFEGNVYTVGEYAQAKVQVLTPAEREIIDMAAKMGMPLSADQIAKMGTYEVRWQPNFKTGLRLSYSGQNRLTGEVNIDADAAYTTSDNKLDLVFSVRSEIPSNLDKSEDEATDTILMPFLTRESLLDGDEVGGIGGSWASRLKTDTTGVIDLDSAFNLPSIGSKTFQLSASVSQSVNWRNGGLTTQWTQIGMPLRVNFSPSSYWTVDPILSYDWIKNVYGYQLTSKVKFQVSDQLSFNVAGGSTATNLGWESVFARAEFMVEDKDFSLSTFVLGQDTLGMSKRRRAVGVTLAYDVDQGPLEGFEILLEGEIGSTSPKPQSTNPNQAPERDASVSLSFTLPF